jgi:hypothetical protein
MVVPGVCSVQMSPHPKPLGVGSIYPRIPMEESVTIAIGLLASDGILVATDREGSDLHQKLDQGKVKARFINSSPYDSLIISGAGNSACVDAMTEQLFDWFSTAKPSKLVMVATNVRSQNKEFYREHVLPFSQYPSEYRPDYSLLVASKIGDEKGLWVSDGLVLNSKEGFAAVGAGGPTARMLLHRFYAYIPTISSINLAVYVIGEVKQLVTGCGLDTDVLYACHGYEPGKVVRDEIREIENGLRGFGHVLERAAFHRYIGSDLSLDPRTKPDDVKRKTKRIENIFRRINKKRIKQFTSPSEQ